jgi:hypothetical protein
MKSSFFLATMPCTLVKINPCFRETYYLHSSGQRVLQARNEHDASRANYVWKGQELYGLEKTSILPFVLLEIE